MKRLGRGAAELTAIAEKLGQQDIGLELLTGPLAGVYDPSGHGAALFAFFAGMAESELSTSGRSLCRARRRLVSAGGGPQPTQGDRRADARLRPQPAGQGDRGAGDRSQAGHPDR